MGLSHGRQGFVLSTLILAAVAALSASQTTHAAIVALGDVNPAAPVDGAALTVGDTNIGYLTINNRTTLTTTTTIIGDDAGGVGYGLVTDQLATWNTNNFTIGRAGIGDLEIASGAIVNVAYPSGVGNFSVGSALGGIGTVVVNGLGSFLRMGNTSTIGSTGNGLLRIENNGFVDATNTPTTTADLFTVGINGRVELANGKLRTGRLENSGAIGGSGWIRVVSDMQNSGRIAVGLNELLTLDTALNNTAYVEINGGEIEFTGGVTNSSAGAEVSLRDGVARFKQTTGIQNTTGVLASVQGSNDIFGNVLNGAAGRIVVAGESTAVFHDNVDNNGSLEVSVGSEAVYLGGLDLGSGSSVLVGLSKDDDDQLVSGQLHAAGPVDLAGTLKVSLVDGYVPSEGDSFELFSAGSITGTVTLASPPTLPGPLVWGLNITPTSVTLFVDDPTNAPPTSGDYNRDGVVNAADYTVWRNLSGQQGSNLAADGFPDGIINMLDYQVWKSHFGQTVGAGSATGGSANVPEPATFMFGFTGLAFLLCGFRRKR